MATYNYNDYYKYKLYSGNNCLAQNAFGSNITISGGGGGGSSNVTNQYTTTTTTPYVEDVPMRTTTTAATTDYYPTMTTTSGYGPIYIDETLKPATMTYTSATATTTHKWDLKLNLNSIDFDNTPLKNASDPTDASDATTKRYVDAEAGNRWWNFPALGTVNVNSQLLNNARITFNDPCDAPSLSPDGVLVLNGNGTSHGRWTYRMTRDINRFEIFNMAPDGQFTLIVKGDPDNNRKINFCGNGTNYIYTSWRGPITIGKQTYITINVTNMPPDILMHMVTYN